MSPRQPTPEPPPLPPVLEFLRALWSLNHALEVTSSAMHRASGVTAQQRMILRIVGHLGTVTAGTLSSLLHVHPGTLSAALRRLEGRGLLSRERSSNDARRVMVALTDQGSQLLTTTEGSVERAAASVLDLSDAASVDHTLRFLEQMAQTLESRLGERGGAAEERPDAPDGHPTATT